jgi:MFS family permease
VSDLLEAASAALGAPADLVQRSAAARAAVDGTSVDDILAAWSGGAPAPTPAPPPPAAETSSPEPEPEVAPAPEPVLAPTAVIEPPTPGPPEPGPEAEPATPLEPVPMRIRIRTAVRIGAWTGAALGLVGFLVATAFWAPNATVQPDGGPVVQVGPNGVIIVMALVSIVFGAVVAGVSRAATGWSNPAMQLSSSKAATAWLGAVLGLLLGIVAGALLNSFGFAVEGSDPPMVQLPVLSTLFVMVIGGAVLGAVTALLPQVIGVPVAVDETDREEVEEVRGRLRNAVSIPLAGLIMLLFLVLPFAFALIESNHLAPGVGGAIVAILTAAGILGFAALSGTKPQMRISFGDVMVALIGIGIVLAIIISVMFYVGGAESSAGNAETRAPVVQL